MNPLLTSDGISPPHGIQNADDLVGDGPEKTCIEQVVGNVRFDL